MRASASGDAGARPAAAASRDFDAGRPAEYTSSETGRMMKPPCDGRAQRWGWGGGLAFSAQRSQASYSLSGCTVPMDSAKQRGAGKAVESPGGHGEDSQFHPDPDLSRAGLARRRASAASRRQAAGALGFDSLTHSLSRLAFLREPLAEYVRDLACRSHSADALHDRYLCQALVSENDVVGSSIGASP